MTVRPSALTAQCDAFMRARARIVWPTGGGAAIWLTVLYGLPPSAWTQAGAWVGLFVTAAAVVALGPADRDVRAELRDTPDPQAAHLRRRLFGVRGWFDHRTGAILLTPIWMLLAYRAVYGF